LVHQHYGRDFPVMTLQERTLSVLACRVRCHTTHETMSGLTLSVFVVRQRCGAGGSRTCHGRAP
jgi:hypothetical protein